MTLNNAIFNVQRVSDWRFAVRVLGKLKTHCVDVVDVQETHFILKKGDDVLEVEYVISAFGYRISAGVPLSIEGSLNVDVYVVLVNEVERLVVVDVAVRSFKFRVVAVYAPSIPWERLSLFRRLQPFLTGSEPLRLTPN